MKLLDASTPLGSIFGIFGMVVKEKYFIKITKKEEDEFLINLDLYYFDEDVENFYFFYNKIYKLMLANKLEFKPKKLHINIGDFIMEINCYKDKIVCEKPQIKEIKCLLIEMK